MIPTAMHMLNAYVEGHASNRHTEGDTSYALVDTPLLYAVADAADPLFGTLRQEGVVHPEHGLPSDWLAGAACVLSVYFPFSEHVYATNRGGKLPSEAWLYSRHEGGDLLIPDALRALETHFHSRGIPAAAPVLHPEFRLITPLISNWSERHVAYVAGLGTFGLHRSIITERGSAGRFGSIVLGRPYPATPRAYEGYDEWCTHCNSCVTPCPVGSIQPEGKQMPPCEKYVAHTRTLYAPRYGCGKCFCGVPCEHIRP